MSFKAKLYIEGEERNLLDMDYEFNQKADYNGRPSQLPVGAPIRLTFESTRNDALFYDYMFHPTQKFKGYIRFFKRDGMQKHFDFEFANAHIVHLFEQFSSTSKIPMYIDVTITYGISRVKGVIHGKKWNPSNPFVREEAKVVNKEPNFLGYFFEDEQGNEITQEKLKNNQVFYLIIETENAQNETVTINLDDDRLDFKYNGKIAENDILNGIAITGDVTRIQLTAINQEIN